MNKKNKMKYIIIIVGILIILTLIYAITMLKPKKEEDFSISYSKDESRGEIQKVDSVEKRKDSVKKENLKINEPLITEVIQNPDLDPLSLNGLTAYYLDGFSFESGKILIYQKFGNIKSIIFRPSFNRAIIEDLTVNSTKDEILRKLNVDESVVVRENYIFVESDDIAVVFAYNAKYAAVYFKDKSKKSVEEFIKLTKKYAKDDNIKDYITGMTDKYPNYSDYSYNAYKVFLRYPELGIEIQKNENTNYDGIYIYENAPEFTKLIEELKTIKFIGGIKVRNKDSNLIVETLLEIVEKDFSIKEAAIDHTYKYPFNVSVAGSVNLNADGSAGEQRLNKCIVIFKDDKLERFNLNESQTADYILLTSKYIYYSINKDGVYRLEPYSRTLTKIYEGTDNKLELKEYDENTQTITINNIKVKG